MAAITMDKRTAEYLISEDIYYSRDEVTVDGPVDGLLAGAVLGQITNGTASSAAQGGNTGNATMSAVTVSGTTIAGVYQVEFTSATAFYVRDPNGLVVGTGLTSVAFTGPLGFTITAGGTPMVAGDGFNVTVAAGSGSYVAYAAAATDGSQRVAGILFDGVDDGTAVKRTITKRTSEVNLAHLTYTGTEATVVAGLAALGIIAR